MLEYGRHLVAGVWLARLRRHRTSVRAHEQFYRMGFFCFPRWVWAPLGGPSDFIVLFTHKSFLMTQKDILEVRLL